MSSNNKYSYQVFGFNVSSCIKCPELVATKEKPDVYIEFGSVPDSLLNPRSTGKYHQAKTGKFLLTISETAKYLVLEGNRIIIEPITGANTQDLRMFLLGSAMGALLHQRGMLPLHASAVNVKNKCVIFCGGIGTGKSSIASEFLSRGHYLHADDICVISLSKSKIPIAFPAYPQLKLLEDIFLRTHEKSKIYSLVKTAADKFLVSAKDQFHGKPLLIKKIYILTPSDTSRIKFIAMTGIEKFNCLKNYTYRGQIVAGLGKEVSHFKIAGVVGKHIPISQVIRPKNQLLLKELADMLEKDLVKEE